MKTTKTRILSVLTAVAIALTVAGCGDDTQPIVDETLVDDVGDFDL